MNFIRYFFLGFMTLTLNLIYAAPVVNNKPASIERYKWLGGNKSGTSVAFILSYFGPASGSPMVKLIVKKAGEVEPIFIDSSFSISGGGEEELEEMSLNLIEKNTAYLNSLGISLSADFISEAHTIIPQNKDPIESSGWVDIQNVGLKSFTVNATKADICSYDPNLNSFGLEFWLEGSQKITLPANSEHCGSGQFAIRNVFKTQKILWFIVYQHSYGLGPSDTWWIDVEGIKF